MTTANILSKDENPDNEKISTISDGPTPDITPDDVEKAEEETKEDTDEKDGHAEEKASEKEASEDEDISGDEVDDQEIDDALENEDKDNGNDTHDLEDAETMRYTTRFKNVGTTTVPLNFYEDCIAKYGTPFNPRGDHLEYGTPAGIVVDDYGTEDAGDAVIIDSEIQPTKGTQDGESDEDTNEADDAGSDLGDAITFYRKHSHEYPGNEDFAEFGNKVLKTIGSTLFKFCKFLLIKSLKYARKVFIFGRKKLSNVVLKRNTIMKLWRFKLSRNLSNVDKERLSEKEIDAFPFQVWTKLAKLSLHSFDIISSAESLLSHASEGTTKKLIDDTLHDFKVNGITVSLTTTKVDITNALDEKRFKSVADLGYTTDVLNNCIRYTVDMAHRVPNPKLDKTEQIIEKCIAMLASESEHLTEQVSSGELKKTSDEYKRISDNLVEKQAMLSFILTCQKVSYILFDLLISDAEKVFSKYEDCLVSRKFD